jgi:hypothetical protein
MRSLCVLLMCLLGSTPALAHKLRFDVTQTGRDVRIEAYYDTDDKADGASVRVVTEAGELLYTGQTDHAGFYTFTAPADGKYKVTVDAGDGHQWSRRVVVPAPEFPDSPEPTRAEVVQIPYARLAFGVAIIAGLAVAAWAALRPAPKC